MDIFWHICKKVKIIIVEVKYSVRFSRGSVKFCFTELGHRNLITKIGTLSCIIVLSPHSAKKFAHHSMYPGYFCKDPRKCACFGILLGKARA